MMDRLRYQVGDVYQFSRVETLVYRCKRLAVPESNSRKIRSLAFRKEFCVFRERGVSS
jgi:hypothetical protein